MRKRTQARTSTRTLARATRRRRAPPPRNVYRRMRTPTYTFPTTPSDTMIIPMTVCIRTFCLDLDWIVLILFHFRYNNRTFLLLPVLFFFSRCSSTTFTPSSGAIVVLLPSFGEIVVLFPFFWCKSRIFAPAVFFEINETTTKRKQVFIILSS